MKSFINSYLNDIGYLKQQILYTNIIQQQAITLFTPISFLKNVVNNLNIKETNILKYTLEDIIKISSNQLKNKEKFTNYLSIIKNKNIEFALVIIFTQYSFNELFINLSNLNISNKKQQYIINSCLSNTYCPANCFSNVSIINNNITVITLNKARNKTDIELITNLNHQLQHYFEKYSQLNKNSINRNIEILFSNIQNIINDKNNKKLIDLFVKIDYLNNNFSMYDLITHLFNEKQFYPMLVNTSNCLKYYFINNKKSILEKLSLVKNMLSENFILSNSFNNLTLNMQSSILFLYTNKCLSNQRYNICLNELKQQFKENQSHFNKHIQFINNTKDWFKTFLNKIFS